MEAITLHAAERAADAFVNVGMSVPRNQESAARNQVHQPLEGGLHFVEVFVYVGVIEFDGCKNYRIRKVVEKLWPFVEECRVILIAFQNELIPGTEHERAAKVFGNSADKETGGAPGMMEQPRQQGRGRGFAVRARYHQPLPSGQEFVVQDLGH